MKGAIGRPRRTARVAALGAVGLVAGLIAGPGSAAQARDADVTVAYECQFPAGPQEVRAEFTGAYPDEGAVNRPIQPGETTVKLNVPRAALAGALPEGTVAVTGRATVTAHVGQNGKTVEAAWQNLATPLTPLPESGDLELVHQGPVPSVTVTAPGEVTFTAGDFKLTLTPRTADSGSGGNPSEDPSGEPSGEPSESPGEEGRGLGDLALPSVACEPRDGQDARLATVPVPEEPGPDPTATASGDTPGTGQPGGTGPGGIDVEATEPPPAAICPTEKPAGQIDESFVPQPPPGDPPRVINLPGTHGCAYAVGLANVRKLNSAMIINDPKKDPQLVNVLVVIRSVIRSNNAKGGGYQRFDSLGELKLRDAESTFLTFGFQPVTAKVEFINGPLTVSTGEIRFTGGTKTPFAQAGFYQSLRVYDVKVNGTPLDVGPNCRSARPYRVVLHGKFPEYVHIMTGGRMSGDLTIPEFAGCGTAGEDLDQLFSASISGSGNHIEMIQGPVCVPKQTNTTCPPKLPELPGS
ncbi:DUF6801 domain-containing protein [Streptomyces sp. NPDC052236]|uniref:DUF6801 domain-containing protein n=1 Tax=Streptomyces sp. NPDC052236 TaxID=3365686 RepID=UPI0037D70956